MTSPSAQKAIPMTPPPPTTIEPMPIKPPVIVKRHGSHISLIDATGRIIISKVVSHVSLEDYKQLDADLQALCRPTPQPTREAEEAGTLAPVLLTIDGADGRDLLTLEQRQDLATKPVWSCPFCTVPLIGSGTAWRHYKNGCLMQAVELKNQADIGWWNLCCRVRYGRDIPSAHPPKPEPTEAMLEEANDLLRSAHAIAERKGFNTNWEAFKLRVLSALISQSDVMHKTVHIPAATCTAKTFYLEPDNE